MSPRRRYHIRWPGLVFAGLALLIGAASAQRTENMLVWVFASMLAWIVVSGIISGGMMMALRVRRRAPRVARVGEPCEIRYEVASASRLWPIFDVEIREVAETVQSPTRLEHCPRGGHAQVRSTLTPARRGVLRLHRFRCVSGFPFGLILKSVEWNDPCDVLVHPRQRVVDPLVLRTLVGSAPGTHGAQQRSGGVEDFIGLREYRSGDSVRQVAWRRSAALMEPVVIERAIPSRKVLCVALDLTRTEGTATESAEENAIEWTASVLSRAHADGWSVQLVIEGLAAESAGQQVVTGLAAQLDALALIDLITPRHAAWRGTTEVASGIALRIVPGRFP